MNVEKRARLGDSGIKYPENGWDVLGDLTAWDWAIIIGVSIAGGIGFWFLLGLIAGI